jgi:hypothetical protein
MIGQYLPNNNEKSYSAVLQKNLHLNAAYVGPRWRHWRRRRHQGEVTRDEEEDATLNLLLKYSDATLTIYVLRWMKTLEHMRLKHLKHTCKIHRKTLETIVNMHNVQRKHLQHLRKTYTTSK